jgi:hypothetical protein
MASLSIGDYEQEIIAALAYDLAARVAGLDPSEYNFSDKRLKRLVRQYGKEVLGGLNKKLPKPLRAGIEKLVQTLAG